MISPKSCQDFQGEDQPNSQCDAPKMASNEDVASNPDGGPVNPVVRETTPEARNDPIVPASGSHLVASHRLVNNRNTCQSVFQPNKFRLSSTSCRN